MMPKRFFRVVFNNNNNNYYYYYYYSNNNASVSRIKLELITSELRTRTSSNDAENIERYDDDDDANDVSETTLEARSRDHRAKLVT